MTAFSKNIAVAAAAFLLFCHSLCGQEAQVMTLYGHVTDNGNGDGLFYSSVSLSGTRFFVNSADYVISYKCFDDVWYYDYCRVDVNFSTRKVHSPFRANFSVTEEMAVTDHKNGGIAIEPAGRVRFRDVLSDRVADFTDSSFWEDYNIIEPDQSIDVLVRKIVRQLQKRD